MSAPFDAVVFDNDGLLLDTEQAWTRAEETLFERRGRAFSAEHKRTLLGSSRSTAAAMLEEMLDRPGAGEDLMDELHELVMAEALQAVPPRPGALELVSALRAAGTPLAVASNSSREFVERVLGGAGLLDGHFQAVVHRRRRGAARSPRRTSTWRPARRWAPSPPRWPRWRTRCPAWPRRAPRVCS